MPSHKEKMTTPVRPCPVPDVVLNCRTAFFAKGTLVTGGRAIMGRYLQTWLLIDLVAAFPIDLVVAVAIPPDERNIVRMAKVVALVRCDLAGRRLLGTAVVVGIDQVVRAPL